MVNVCGAVLIKCVRKEGRGPVWFLRGVLKPEAHSGNHRSALLHGTCISAKRRTHVCYHAQAKPVAKNLLAKAAAGAAAASKAAAAAKAAAPKRKPAGT